LTLKTQIASDLGAIFNTDEHGETLTYTPSDTNVEPFEFVGIWEDSGIDQPGDKVYRDLARCRILQAYLTSAGMTEPVPLSVNQAGDVITRNDVAWVVVYPIEENSFCGEWILTLEKDVRFIP
jgi:hypothetical protein